MLSFLSFPLFAEKSAELASLQQLPEDRGHQHTLQEILQQPEMWRTTATSCLQALPQLQALLDGLATVILTGSGSSEYAGNCVTAAFQRQLGVTAEAIGSGALLTDGASLLPHSRPALMVSFARSGDSPESAGALAEVMAAAPEIRQLALTCNTHGRLAQRAQAQEDIHALVLDPRTNDRSLVMTSSFTSMVLAALSLAYSANPATFEALAQTLADGCESVLLQAFEHLAAVAKKPFSRAFYLASPSTFGAAREAALKMTEMTAGRVLTQAETYLGLRHGPMSAVDGNSLIVCFLSSSEPARSYECDLIRELTDKQLGLAKVLVGSNIPQHLVQPNDIVIEHAAFAAAGDDSAAILHVVAGQVLAFYRCLQEGLKPDTPSATGVISRVVQGFRLQGHAAETA